MGFIDARYDTRSFREKIRGAIEMRNGDPLSDSFTSMADAVGASFIEAQKEVRMFMSGLGLLDCMNKQLLPAIEYFMASKDHKLRLLLEHENETFEWLRHPFIEPLKAYAQGPQPQLEIRTIQNDGTNAFAFNCLLLDDYGWLTRATTPQSPVTAYFEPKGEKRVAEGLGAYFEKIWEHADPLPPLSPARHALNRNPCLPAVTL